MPNSLLATIRSIAIPEICRSIQGTGRLGIIQNPRLKQLDVDI
ncbi:hypothetical protein [Chamaesiphon sp. VAR_48_metabat_135_sub]|nr:hypothetical protein [Chamaesiphon sp. VAR_48_metabat_135_sub]